MGERWGRRRGSEEGLFEDAVPGQDVISDLLRQLTSAVQVFESAGVSPSLHVQLILFLCKLDRLEPLLQPLHGLGGFHFTYCFFIGKKIGDENV